jgi:tetratricopeptide (TPR) repeat protein
VNKEASRLIFHDVYPDSKEDPDVDALIAAVGHMPYAVVLMAKSGETCDFTAKMLLEEWKQAGTEMISHSGSPEEDMNRSIGLSVNRNFVQQNPDALLLLQTLALLPVGTSMDNLRQWAPNIKSLSSAIRTLSSAALLLQSEGHMTPKILSILPVVQSFMHTTGQIPEEVRQNTQKACYRFIFNHISQCDANPRDFESIAIAEDRNIRLIMLNSKPTNIPISLDLHLKYLIYFSQVSCHRRNPDISEQALGLARESGDQKMIAQALFALALVYGRKNAYDIAERYFSESYDLLGMFTDPESTQKTLECGLMLVRCKQVLHQPPQVIIEFLQTLSLTPGDDFQRTLVKKNLGDCLRMRGQFPEALCTLQEAKDLFMRTGHLDQVAGTLSLISDSYYLSFQVEKCLASIWEAREVAKSSGIMTKTVIASFDFKRAYFLFMLQRDMEALPIFQECLPIFESAQSSTVVDCFMHMGSIHARQGSHDDACVAFESAIAKCTELNGDTVSGRDKIMLLERLKEQTVGR